MAQNGKDVSSVSFIDLKPLGIDFLCQKKHIKWHQSCHYNITLRTLKFSRPVWHQNGKSGYSVGFIDLKPLGIDLLCQKT